MLYVLYTLHNSEWTLNFPTSLHQSHCSWTTGFIAPLAWNWSDGGSDPRGITLFITARSIEYCTYLRSTVVQYLECTPTETRVFRDLINTWAWYIPQSHTKYQNRNKRERFTPFLSSSGTSHAHIHIWLGVGPRNADPNYANHEFSTRLIGHTTEIGFQFSSCTDKKDLLFADDPNILTFPRYAVGSSWKTIASHRIASHRTASVCTEYQTLMPKWIHTFSGNVGLSQCCIAWGRSITHVTDPSRHD